MADEQKKRAKKPAEKPAEPKAVEEPAAASRPKKAAHPAKEPKTPAAKPPASVIAPPQPAAPAAAPAPKNPYDIGLDVPVPGTVCQDRDCPFHGVLPVRGQVIEGVVVSDGMEKSVVVRRERLRLLPKFERYEKRSSKLHAHNPPCIAAKSGDSVTLAECRPLSKTISFVVVRAQRGGAR